MERQKKNDSGITLVALVVSIIVMLVLAGVSLNATVGENGIVTRAQEAALKQRVAEELENLNLELTKMNVDTISENGIVRIQDIADYLIEKNAIDSVVLTSAGQIAAGVDSVSGDRYFFGKKRDNTYKISRNSEGILIAELTEYSSGGDITGGYALVTQDSFTNDDSLSATEKGKFTITSDAEVVFMDTISGALSIYVQSGVHATVGIYANLELTNEDIDRSAIEIEKGGELDLFLDENVEVVVNSGFGHEGVTAQQLGAEGGPGGYAGIRVPMEDTNNNGVFDTKENPAADGTYDDYAILNIKGKGKLVAYGGKAGNGGGSLSGNKGGGGGGGAGAGIGGNGGKGGKGNYEFSWTNASSEIGESGSDGGNAESCGIINILGDTQVYAYGGGGGAGGRDTSNDSGAGAGGYPAAGIGGGGAGGGGADHQFGAGGYSGGNGWSDRGGNNSINGLGSQGGGYYTKGRFTDGINNTWQPQFGQGECWSSGNSYAFRDHSGNGGISGAGGIITYTKLENIHAYNGNLVTNNVYTNIEEYDITGAKTGETLTAIKNLKDEDFIPAIIFAQNGTLRESYHTNQHMTEAECTLYGVPFVSTWNGNGRNVKVFSNENTDTTSYGQGIGSGAGWRENNNGKLISIK